MPSANIGDRYALFEPVHGSAPDIAGKNIANPVAALRSAAMLLAHLGDKEGSQRIELAICEVLATGIQYRDIGDRPEPASSVMRSRESLAGRDRLA